MFIICHVSEACDHCKLFSSKSFVLTFQIGSSKSLNLFLQNKPTIMQELVGRNVMSAIHS